MPHFLQSKGIKITLSVIAGLIVLFVVFGFGLLVGYRSAIFNTRFGMEYYHNFYAGAPGPLGLPGQPVTMSGYGIAGKVLEVGTSTIAVQDPSNNEQAILVDSDTVIRENNGTITINDVIPGESVVAIGDPDASGAMHARFIRVFTATSSMPQMNIQM